MRSLTLYRCLCLLGVGVLVAFGVAKTVFNSWGYIWLLDLSGDVIYEVAWIWIVGAWKVRWPVRRIAIATFTVTSLIEISQLIPFPNDWVTQLWWRLLLGTHFAWPDFLYYAVGCCLGGISLSWLRKRLGIRYASRHNLRKGL